MHFLNIPLYHFTIGQFLHLKAFAQFNNQDGCVELYVLFQKTPNEFKYMLQMLKSCKFIFIIKWMLFNHSEQEKEKLKEITCRPLLL